MIVVNITSWAGRCIDAKHLYAKYSDTTEIVPEEERLYIESLIRRGHYSVGSIELKKFPTLEESKRIIGKDCSYIDPYDYVEYGTIRFNSLREIKERLEFLFPNTEVVYYYHGSKKKFEEICHLL